MRNKRKALTATLALACAAGFLVPVATQQQALAGSRHHRHCHSHCPKQCESSLVGVAKSEGLTTFLAAVSAAGLTKELEGKGPYTVFAPSNAAFSKLPKAQLDRLLKDQKQLKQILLYHVVKGKVTAADISSDKHALTTLEGEKLHTNVKDGKVQVGGGLVSKADVKACNGLLHVVDDVLTPPGYYMY